VCGKAASLVRRAEKEKWREKGGGDGEGQRERERDYCLSPYVYLRCFNTF
tara:strand:- start:23 stop:172 length:150 start_codon:yes stop_codon:yes gene_type:complete